MTYLAYLLLQNITRAKI